MNRPINRKPAQKRGKRVSRKASRKVWEQLDEKPIVGIDTLPDGGLVSTPIAAKAVRKGRSDRLAATPAPKKDQIVGSSRNQGGSASSSSSGRSIVIDESTLTSLKTKVKEHNESVAGGESWKRTSLGTLKSVYRRGAGAFSVSHRPGMTRNQWAMGRVNAFLKILKSGKPNNSRYVTDNDLLPADHPWRKKTQSKGVKRVIFREVSRLQEIPQNEIKEMVRVHNRQMTRSGSPEWTKTDSKSLSEVWRRATARKADPAVEAQAFLGNLEGKDGRRKYNFVNADLMPKDHPWLQNSKAAMLDRVAQFKALRKISKRQSVGVTEGVRRGLVVVDELGIMRCPPGTVNAMQFTNMQGEGCMNPAGSRGRMIGRQVLSRAAHQEVISSLSNANESTKKKANLPLKEVDRLRFKNMVKTLKGEYEDFEGLRLNSPKVKDFRKGVLERIKDQGGITISPLSGNQPTSGWAIARKGEGIRIALNEFFDGDEPKQEAIALLHFYIADSLRKKDGKRRFDEPDDERSIGTFFGGWIDADEDKNKWLYLDTVDVFDKDQVTEQEAMKIGFERDQIAMTDLDELEAGNMSAAFPKTGGTGGEYADLTLPFRTLIKRKPSERSVEELSEGPRVQIVNKDKPNADWGEFAVDSVSDAHIEKMIKTLNEKIGENDFGEQVGTLDDIEKRFSKLLEVVTEEDFDDGLVWYPKAKKTAEDMARSLGIETWKAAGIIAVLSPNTKWNQNVWMAEWTAKWLSKNQVIDDEFIAMVQGMRLAAFSNNMDRYMDGAGLSGLINISVEDIEKYKGKRIKELLSDDEGLDILTLALRAYGAKETMVHENKKFRPNQIVIDEEASAEKGETVYSSVQWTDFESLKKALSLASPNATANDLDVALGGAHKVRSFYNNIMFPYESRDSTIDVHMGSIGAGKKITSSGPLSDAIFTVPTSKPEGVAGGYPLFQIAMRRTLDRFNERLDSINEARQKRGLKALELLDLPQLQAILWVAHRRAPFGEGLDSNSGALSGVELQ
jgi:hypothetical protein